MNSVSELNSDSINKEKEDFKRVTKPIFKILEEIIMQKKYESEYCDVSYIEEKNLVFVEWKKYCEFDTYRKPLMIALQVIKEYKCDYVADTRNGFEDNPEDTKWIAEFFMPTASEYGCKTIFFIIDKANSLKEELDGQANDSADIINFRYVFTIDEIE